MGKDGATQWYSRFDLNQGFMLVITQEEIKKLYTFFPFE